MPDPGNRPPRPPRPPPVPSLPLSPEPFPRAKSDPPPAVDRGAITPRSGGVPLPVDDDPRDKIIGEMHAQLVLLREQIESHSSLHNPSPLPPASIRTRTKQQFALVFGKYAFVAYAVLNLAIDVLANIKPEWAPVLKQIKLLGGAP